MSADELIRQLDDFDPAVRSQALKSLIKTYNTGQTNNFENFVNLHCHSFFSFNCYGYSPSGIAWKARAENLESVGIIDFDVLDGIDEIINAGHLLGIRTVAGIETRVFVKEYADQVINSPNEPGIHYAIATGFYRLPDSKTGQGRFLTKLKQISRRRNISLISKVNDFLSSVKIDYEKDVLVLTPSGNATERHILEAYDRKTRNIFKNNIPRLVGFWSEKLGQNADKIKPLLEDHPNLLELIRKKLMKYGGVGYQTPEPKNFPSLSEVNEFVKSAGGLPVWGWLDGTNEGEKDIYKLLTFAKDTGHVLVNIIPERNWNIKDPAEKKIKTEKLAETVECCRKLGLPIIGGTEMNKFGQRFVDDFNAPEIKPYLDDFRRGAFLAYGHTMLGLYTGRGYFSSWAESNFPDTQKRNEFYINAGRSLEPGEKIEEQIKKLFN